MRRSNPQRQKNKDSALSLLDVAIEAMNIAKELSNETPAKAIFGSASVLLTMIRARFLFSDGLLQVHTSGLYGYRIDYVELGLVCVDVCEALDQGMKGRRMDELSQSEFEAIGRLTTWVEPAMRTTGRLAYRPLDRRAVADIQRNIVKYSKRNTVSQLLHAKNDEETVAT